jgi:hypothetical protein
MRLFTINFMVLVAHNAGLDSFAPGWSNSGVLIAIIIGLILATVQDIKEVLR